MSLLRDGQFAIRTLRRRRVFSVVALTTLALGIGASTSIYTVVDGILFRPLPFPEPARLLAVWKVYPQWRTNPILSRLWDRIPVSIPEYRDWRAQNTTFREVGIYGSSSMTLGEGDARERVTLTTASHALLDVLGVKPALGRFFSASED